MAYTHETIQVRLDNPAATGVGITLTSTPDLGIFSPGLQPIEVRGVALVVTTTCTTTAPVINFYLQPAASSETSRVLIKSITAPLASFAAGNVIYANIDGQKIVPGQAIQAEVGTSPAAGAGFAVVMYHNSWDAPGNNTKMVASTT